MKTKFTTLLIIISLLISCNTSTNSDRQKELELKVSELSNSLKMSQKSSAAVNYQNNRINELSNIEKIIGYWFTPHCDTMNIRFYRNGHFEFNDYNSTLEKEELLTGTYKLVNGVLSLMYDDRPKQNFKFYKGEKGDLNYYIKKGGYYFVKGENGN